MCKGGAKRENFPGSEPCSSMGKKILFAQLVQQYQHKIPQSRHLAMHFKTYSLSKYAFLNALSPKLPIFRYILVIILEARTASEHWESTKSGDQELFDLPISLRGADGRWYLTNTYHQHKKLCLSIEIPPHATPPHKICSRELWEPIQQIYGLHGARRGKSCCTSRNPCAGKTHYLAILWMQPIDSLYESAE